MPSTSSIQRLFIAAELHSPLKKHIKQYISGIQHKYPDIRFVNEANLHITMNFIGKAPYKYTSYIISAINNALLKQKPFIITLGNIGVFDHSNDICVIWIDIKDGKNILRKINHAVACQLSKIDLKAERRYFKPHITIGRLKHQRGSFDEINKSFPPIPYKKSLINNITLFESILTNCGPIYKSHYTKNLNTI